MEGIKALLQNRIRSKEFAVGIIGLGYVGLPLALVFAKAGITTVGFDVDQTKIDRLCNGASYIQHIKSEDITKLKNNGTFRATRDFSKLKNVDVIIICVPTPLTKYREPDLSYLKLTAKTIASHLRKGQLVILESTTYPGTTEELLIPILVKESGLTTDKEFGVAFSPEREDPGRRTHTTKTIPKIVGGITPEWTEIAAQVYKQAIDTVVPVSSPKTAEMTKLLENIFRSVNIALVNELKVLLDRMGINIWEVINAASTKPFGFTPFYPGPGLGGHCIPIDPFYLTWKAREFGLSTRFIELAGEINTFMPRYVVNRIVKALSKQGKPIKNAKILILGAAYKKDVDDMRESPALILIELLSEEGALVEYHDPYIPKISGLRAHDLEMESVDLNFDKLYEYDVVLIATDHSCFNFNRIWEKAKLIIDTRGVYKDKQEGINFKRA